MIFMQEKGQYIQPATVHINERPYNGKWIIRQTNSLKLWIVEFVSESSWMLSAQQLYQSAESAAQVAADAIRLGVVHNSGKWTPDRSVGPVQPVGFELFIEPESVIDWA